MIETFPDQTALSAAAADAVHAALREALAKRGRASFVATGGRSPGPVYDRLSKADLDWAHVAVTLSDERCVDVDSPNANVRQLRERLFVGPAAEAKFLALTDYAEPALKALTPFDVVLLGMGEDGHVASLIPGSPALAEGMDLSRPGLVLDVPEGAGSPPVARITLTLAALLQSRAIFVLIAGPVKRQVIERALSGEDLPVRAIINQGRVPVRILWSPA